jgi:hypothetical protein
MAANAKKTRGTQKNKKPTTKQAPKAPLLWYQYVGNWFRTIWQWMVRKNQAFLARRPHRSFRLTRRRDLGRSLKTEGYVAFTVYVNRVFSRHWRMFGLLILIYALIMAALGAITTQDTYNSIDALLRGAAGDFFGKGVGQIGQASLVALSAFASSAGNLQPDQHVYLILSLILAWLSTVWLLREIMLGRKPKLRDGLYNSGAPILSTLGVVLVLIVQLLPVGLVVLAYGALSSVGIIEDGFGSMLFWLIAATIAALVLYWITSTIIALVVVTLPGMYPLRAVKLSGDLVVGRRLRIMYRLLWGLIAVVLTWVGVLIVTILLDNFLKMLVPGIGWLPIVPYIGALMTAYVVVWYATYTYLFYRKVVDDDAKPA